MAKSCSTCTMLSLSLPPYGLHGEHVVSPSAIHTNVDLVRLDLADPRHRCAQMTLQRVAGHSSEDINEPIVAQLRQQGLLIIRTIQRIESVPKE